MPRTSCRRAVCTSPGTVASPSTAFRNCKAPAVQNDQPSCQSGSDHPLQRSEAQLRQGCLSQPHQHTPSRSCRQTADCKEQKPVPAAAPQIAPESQSCPACWPSMAPCCCQRSRRCWQRCCRSRRRSLQRCQARAHCLRAYLLPRLLAPAWLQRQLQGRPPPPRAWRSAELSLWRCCVPLRLLAAAPAHCLWRAGPRRCWPLPQVLLPLLSHLPLLLPRHQQPLPALLRVCSAAPLAHWRRWVLAALAERPSGMQAVRRPGSPARPNEPLLITHSA